MFSFKKTVTVLSVVVMPLAAGADSCSGTSGKADQEAVVVCHTTGYHKAGRAEKAAKGSFMTCGGKKCKITIYYKNTKTSTDRKTVIPMKDQGSFNVPKDAHSFGSANCGTIYKKNAKKA